MLPTPAAPPAAMEMGAAGSGSVMAEEAKGLVHVKLWQRTGLAQVYLVHAGTHRCTKSQPCVGQDSQRKMTTSLGNLFGQTQ